jgi:tellurite resistance protein TerC
MKLLKKTLVILLGGSVLVVGLAMLVLPGPAFVVIPTALAILAVEFVWARRWLAWLRERLNVLVPGKTAAVQPPNRIIADNHKPTSQTS